MIKKKCLFCKKVFKSWGAKKQKYCSQDCFRSYKKSKRLNKSCGICGKEFTVFPSWHFIKFCSSDCFGISRLGRKEDPVITKKRVANTKGENHYNFKGWKSREPYGINWNENFKNSIRNRDGYKCQICGVPQMECISKLSVHHINMVKTDLRSENLISLCKSCHGKVHIKGLPCPKPNFKLQEVLQ